MYNQSYDVDKNEWIYKRNKNNNISVFNTNYYSNSYNKLLSGDKIVYLNNLKVSDLSDPEIDEIIANNNNINFKINRKNKDKIETFNYSIEKSIFDQVTNVTPVFRINSFKNIDIKNTEYTINYDFDYWWLDNRLIELIKIHMKKKRSN